MGTRAFDVGGQAGPQHHRLMAGNTLWHGRFEEGPAAELLAFSVSIEFDKRLAPDDIAGSRAHVRGLLRSKILDDGEANAILEALDRVGEELANGSLPFVASDEDVHT